MASDVLGVSGRHMLKALMTGERDPQKLANLAQGHLVGVGIAIARDHRECRTTSLLHYLGKCCIAAPVPGMS